MFDHVLRFKDEAAALAALEPLGYVHEDEGGNARFNASKVLAVRLVLADAVWDNSDPESPTLTAPEVVAPNHYLIVSTKTDGEESDRIKALPGNACRLIASRALQEAGQFFLVYTAPDLNAATLSQARVDPVFAGTSYPFGDLSS